MHLKVEIRVKGGVELGRIRTGQRVETRIRPQGYQSPKILLMELMIRLKIFGAALPSFAILELENFASSACDQFFASRLIKIKISSKIPTPGPV